MFTYASNSFWVYQLFSDDRSRVYLIFLALGCGVWTLASAVIRYRADPDRAESPFAVGLLAIALMYSSYTTPGYVEVHWPARVTKTRMVLRESAARILEFNGRFGVFPESLQDIGGGEPVEDPCSWYGEEIEWWKLNQTEGLLLGVGPDGLITTTKEVPPVVYSPTNGTKSAGDIIHWVRVPTPTPTMP